MKIKLPFLLVLFFMDGRADARASQSSTRNALWASVVPSRAVYEENGARVSLAFTLFNDTKTPVTVRMGETKLLVNGKVVDWNWNNKEYIHQWLKKGDVIKPGASRNIDTNYTTRFYRYLLKPGIYKLRWIGKSFHSPEVSIRLRAHQNDDFETSTMKLVRQIRRILPSGWEVSFAETSRGWIEISRLERTKVADRWMTNDNEINHIETSHHLSFIELAWEVRPLLTPAQYQWRQEENTQIAERMRTLDEKEQLPRSKGNVHPNFKHRSNDKKVARYQWLQSLQQDLPDFYFENISLYKSSSSTEVEEVENAKARRELEIVKARIQSLLKRYEATQ